MKKQIISTVLTAAMATSLLAACGGSGGGTTTAAASGDGAGDASGVEATAAGKTVTLHMWGGVPAESGPQDACDAFNEAYKDKGIQIEYERYVNDETGNMKLETNLLGGNEIDLYMSYTMPQLTKRAEGNMALDLSDLIERDSFDLEGYLGDLVKSYYVDGKPYAIPCKLDQYGMVLNKDMFDAAGIEIPTDWTYDEFIDVCKKLTKGEGQQKQYGTFWNTQQDKAQYVQYFVSQTLGGDNYYTDGGKATAFTDPVWESTVSMIEETMKDGYAPTHADSVTEKLTQESMFLGERSAMTLGPWMIRDIKNTDTYPHTFVTAFAPYPVMDKDSRKFTQGGYGDFLCINPRSENTDAAWEFAKWYLTEGTIYLARGGRVPSSNTFDTAKVTEQFLSGAEDLFDKESLERVIIKPHDDYAALTITTKNTEITDILNEELEAIFTEQKSVEDGMKKAKERADALLAQ